MEKIGILFSEKSNVDETYKKSIISTLEKFDITITNLTSDSKSDVENYMALGSMLKNKELDRAIVIDDFGTLPFMILAKFQNVIVAQISDTHSAHMTSEHNGSNVICLGTQLNSIATIEKIIHNFVQTPFAGGRHVVRTDMLAKMLVKEEN